MPLNFIITDAGRAAIAQVGGSIGPVTLTKIAIGSAGYTPTASRTSLQTEIKRLDPSGSSVPVPGTISITAADNSADSYSVREIGLYTNNNVLFAICSQTGVIMTKGSGSSALFAMDFVMTNVPAGTVTVGNVGFTYSQATETAMGVLGIATTAEAQAGTINTKIITPLRLAEVTATETRRGVIALASTAEAQSLVPDTTKALTVARLVDRTATEARVGVVELATNAETQTGTDATRAVTPAGLASRTATDARAGIVQLATNAETQTGTDATRAVTPAGLASRTATDARAGIVELADNTETQTGTDTTRAVTPASLASRTANTDRAGIVELATSTETQTGTDGTRAVTPAGLASAGTLLVPPGAVMPFASAVTPSGWLAANGNVVPNGVGTVQGVTADFTALYKVVGTTYGAAGTLPDLRGYFVRGSGTNADGTAAGNFGQRQADQFQNHGHSITQNDHIHNEKSYSTADFTGGSGNYTYKNYRQTENTVATTGAKADITIGDPNSGNRGTETRPKNIALLYCIKI